MFDYYGGKSSLARFYQRPRFNMIIEPFAGSAMYSMYHLSRNNDMTAVLVDKSRKVCDAWDWLKSQTVESIMSIPTVKAGCVTSNFFVMNCAASTASMNCRKMKVSDRMEKRQASMWARVARLLRVLPRVSVICGSYESMENTEATWFIDPPYQQTGKALLGNGYARGCRSDDIDFHALAEWCRNRDGQAIVAEKQGATWLPFKPLRMVTDSQDKHYMEVVWNSLPDEQLEFDFTSTNAKS